MRSNVLARPFHVLYACLMTSLMLSTPSTAAPDNDGNGPIHDAARTGYVTQWLALGPFPNPEAGRTLEYGATRTGFNRDYLLPLGGEATAVLTPSTSVVHTGEGGGETVVRAVPLTANEDNVVDLAAPFTRLDFSIAYAFTHIRADRDRTLAVFFGSDDWAKVWLNGVLVYAEAGPGGRGVRARGEHFLLRLKAGLNRVLVKVDQHSGTWAFQFEMAPPEDAERFLTWRRRADELRQFQDVDVAPREEWSYVFSPGAFPELAWKNAEAVRRVWGDVPLTVRWFDGAMNEVKGAEKPGRYAAYVEGALPGGRAVRRAYTFYCAEPDFAPWNETLDVRVGYIASPHLDERVWAEQAGHINETASGYLREMLRNNRRGPVLLAGLSDLKPLGRAPTPLESPDVLDQEYHLRLKRMVLGRETAPGLHAPRKRSGAPALALHPGSPTDAGFAPEAAERIRAACRAWNTATGQPFSVFVARHGVTLLNEGFGSSHGKPVGVDARFDVASLTKTYTGLLFARFVDQGLIQPDDPVGRFLPDFPTEGPRVLTLRHCLTNTSGLEGHALWGGLGNAWLDNVIANGAEALQPGEVYIYNGMGFNLAGKVMEMVAGKSIVRLMHESLFQPLGHGQPAIEDLAFGMKCTAEDLARIGQLLVNEGSYGDTEFFSPETFRKHLLPRPLKESFPNLRTQRQWEYGFGMNWMRDGNADAPILGRRVLGHGAGSGSVLRADLEHGLVVALVRDTPGPDYDTHLNAVLQAVADHLL